MTRPAALLDAALTVKEAAELADEQVRYWRFDTDLKPREALRAIGSFNFAGDWNTVRAELEKLIVRRLLAEDEPARRAAA